MSSPIVALKTAIRLRLASEPAVIALLREPKVFADPPRHAAFPHVAFVTASARDYGTTSDDAHLIDLALGIWTRARGSAEGLEIADAVIASLRGLDDALDGHRLVNLQALAVDPLPLKDGETWRTLIRLRAVTEVV